MQLSILHKSTSNRLKTIKKITFLVSKYSVVSFIMAGTRKQQNPTPMIRPNLRRNDCYSALAKTVNVSSRDTVRYRCYYRPQRSWGKVIFPQASVILSTGGAWSRGVCSWGGCLVWGVVPGPGGCLVETPPDGYCCGRYASYWNAFL